MTRLRLSPIFRNMFDFHGYKLCDVIDDEQGITLFLTCTCRVPKLFRHEVSPKPMVKLTDKKIKWAVKQVINKGESPSVVAAIYGVSARRIQQLAKSYKETGEYPVLDRKRRPRTPLSDEEKRIIEGAYKQRVIFRCSFTSVSHTEALQAEHIA